MIGSFLKGLVGKKNNDEADVDSVRAVNLERRMAFPHVKDFLNYVVTEAQIAKSVELVDDGNSDGAIQGEEESPVVVNVVGLNVDDLQQGKEILDALQHVGARFLFRAGTPRKLIVDAEGLRERRTEELDRLIEEIRERVEAGESFVTQPLSSGERRKVHLALEALELGIRTMSIGHGPKKRIKVRLGRRDRYETEPQSSSVH